MFRRIIIESAANYIKLLSTGLVMGIFWVVPSYANVCQDLFNNRVFFSAPAQLRDFKNSEIRNSHAFSRTSILDVDSVFEFPVVGTNSKMRADEGDKIRVQIINGADQKSYFIEGKILGFRRVLNGNGSVSMRIRLDSLENQEIDFSTSDTNIVILEKIPTLNSHDYENQARPATTANYLRLDNIVWDRVKKRSMGVYVGYKFHNQGIRQGPPDEIIKINYSPEDGWRYVKKSFPNSWGQNWSELQPAE